MTTQEKKPRQRRPTPRPTPDEIKAMIAADVFVPYEGAAFILGVPITTVRALVCTGQIPHTRIGPRTPRFRPSELIAWLEARKVVPIRKARGGRNTGGAEDRRRAATR